MRKFIEWAKRRPLTTAVLLFLVLWVVSTVIVENKSTMVSLSRDGGFGLSAPAGMIEPAFSDDMAVMEESVAMKATSSFMPAPPPFPFEPTSGESAAEVEQRIIKTGSLRIVVEEIADAVSDLTAQAEEVGGFVESSSVVENRSGRQTGHAVIRVPVDAFEESMSKIRGLADLVREETVEGQDVTERYSDLSAQLRNAQAQEEAYLTILRRAVSVEDILSVQRELGNIRSQIEVLTGRLKYLENRTSLSTIRVTLEEDVDIQIPTTRFKPYSAAKQAVQALVSTFQGAVISLIWVAILGLGLGIPAALVIWIVWRLVRRYWKKRRK